MSKLFPTPDAENLLICVSSVGDKKDFSCLITNKMTDLHIVGTTQCFSLHWYEDAGGKRSKMKVASIDGTADEPIRRDGISDFALKLAEKKYGKGVTKEDIFFYVYGYLHSQEYREAFSQDLKLALPKIGFSEKKEDFLAFSRAGRELAEIHLNYESVKAPEELKFSGVLKIEDIPDRPDMCRVRKMKVLPKERKVVYNQHLTVENIPAEAFEYVVNGRSAIEWIAEQYQYSVDKESGIVNDPNEYGGGAYVLNLLLSIIAVSVRTGEIVKKLPKLELGEAPQCQT
jgi:predicted helicase